MAWQKITRFIEGNTVQVESKDGKQYPVECSYDWMANGLYEQLVNVAHDHKEYWAWVDFDGENPTIEEWTRSPEGEGPPETPPWER